MTMIVLQILFVHAPFMNAVFSTAALSWSAWLAMIALGAAMAAIVGIEKKISAHASAVRASRP